MAAVMVSPCLRAISQPTECGLRSHIALGNGANTGGPRYFAVVVAFTLFAFFPSKRFYLPPAAGTPGKALVDKGDSRESSLSSKQSKPAEMLGSVRFARGLAPRFMNSRFATPQRDRREGLGLHLRRPLETDRFHCRG
jgi:hypothetical protein